MGVLDRPNMAMLPSFLDTPKRNGPANTRYHQFWAVSFFWGGTSILTQGHMFNPLVVLKILFQKSQTTTWDAKKTRRI